MSEVEAPNLTIPSFAPKGIGGWLLFFAFSLTVISPAVLFRSSYVFLRSSQRFHKPAVIGVYEMASWTELIIAIAFLGTGLLVGFKRRQAKIMVPLVLALGAASGITLWSLHLLLPLDAPLRELWRDKMLFPMFQRIFYACLWTWYWMSSERVENTFADIDL